MAAKSDSLARHDIVAADPKLDRALSADQHIVLGYEIVLLDRGSIWERQTLERVLAQHGKSKAVEGLKLTPNRLTEG